MRSISVLITGLALLVPAAVAAPAAAAGSAASSCGQPTVRSTSISPSTVHGGDGALQTVTLTAPARAPFSFVVLDGTDYAYIESTGLAVRVPAGKRSVTFPVKFTGTPRRAVLSFSAGVCNVEATAPPVTVIPQDPARLAVKSVTIAPSTATLSDVITTTVHLTAPARSRGTTLLTGNNANGGTGGGSFGLSDPRIITVPAGRTSVSFTQRLNGRATPSLVGENANLGTSQANGFFLAVPKSLDVSSGSARGTNKLALGIGVRAPAGGARVAVSVRYPGVHVPDVVTVPAGDRGVLFPVTVDRSVDPYRYGTITVRWNGQSVTHRFYIY